MSETDKPTLARLAGYIGAWMAAFGAVGLGFLGITLPIPLVLALGVAFGGFSWVLKRGVHVADGLVWPAPPTVVRPPSEANKDVRAYLLAQAVRAAFVHDDWARLSRVMTELADLASRQPGPRPHLSPSLQTYLDAARTRPATARLRDQASLSRHIEELSHR